MVADFAFLIFRSNFKSTHENLCHGIKDDCFISLRMLRVCSQLVLVRSFMTSFVHFHKALTSCSAPEVLVVNSKSFLIIAWSVVSALTFASFSFDKSRWSRISVTFFTLSINWMRFLCRKRRFLSVISKKGKNKWQSCRNKLLFLFYLVGIHTHTHTAK